jgi:integrase
MMRLKLSLLPCSLSLQDFWGALLIGRSKRLNVNFEPTFSCRAHRKHVQARIDARASKPSGARNFLISLRAAMHFAIAEGWRKDDPTVGVQLPKIETSGYRTWEEQNIAAFRAAHPIGTRARLALELLLCTGQRRGDVTRMGRQHVRDGVLYVRQEKTGAEVNVPILPPLQAAIDSLPAEHLTFLVSANGKPFTPHGFGNWFRECCRVAGLKGLSPHGLRKATCRRLAEAGRSTKQIASVSGHKTLREVERYTEAADRKRMAREAMEGMAEVFEEQPRTDDLHTPMTGSHTPAKALKGWREK